MPFTSPWNLPKPRTEPTSCALAGGFFTNEPHLKPLLSALAFCNLTFFHQHSTKNLFTSDYSGLPVAYSIAYLNYIKLDCAPTFEYNLLAFLMILFNLMAFNSIYMPLTPKFISPAQAFLLSSRHISSCLLDTFLEYPTAQN